MKYPPTIKIGGVVLPCDFDATATNPVVLDGITINWGRDAVYDATSPSELRLDLIDPHGQYASDPGLFGEEITVETSLGMIFRGRIDGIEMRPDTIDDANPNVPEDVWFVSISATDVIGTLAKVVAPGYETGSSVVAIKEEMKARYGPGYWDGTDTEKRRSQIQTRIAERGIPTKLETTPMHTMLPPGYPSTYANYFKETLRQSGPNLYEMVQSVQLRGNQPMHTNYLPGRDALTAGKWTLPAALNLRFDSNRIDVMAAGDVFVVDCSQVAIDTNAVVHSSVTHNISSIRVSEGYYKQEIISGTTNVYVNVWADAPLEFPVTAFGLGTAQYEPPIALAQSKVSLGGGVYAYSQSGADYANALKPYIEAINGKLNPPEMAFDIESYDYGVAIETALLATWTTEMPWSFPGSRYEPLIGFGPVFQHIGGELTFRGGWTVSARFSPAMISPAAGDLTISQLVTTDAPLFSHYADRVQLVTLAAITKGI